MEQPHDMSAFAARYSATEQRVGTLEIGFDKLSSRVDNGFEKLQSSIGILASNIGNIGKTDWKLMAAAGGVVLTIVTGIGSMAKAPIDSQLASLTIASIEARNDIRQDRDTFMKRDDWRYERDRGWGQLKEVDEKLEQRLGKLEDKVDTNHENFLRSGSAK